LIFIPLSGIVELWRLSLIRNFGNRVSEEIWEMEQSKHLPKELWVRAKALLTIMHGTIDLNDLKLKGQPPNIRLHKLKGDRKDQWSVTIRLPWCITFSFKAGEFINVKIENYH
jgi:toxin HigB-1